MTHFAKIVNGVVTKVIVAEQDFIDNMVDTSPGRWIKTYKDRSVHTHFAGLGYTYDKTRQEFIPPKPFNSWTLNEATLTWEPPVALPTDGGDYTWNEETQAWDAVTE